MKSKTNNSIIQPKKNYPKERSQNHIQTENQLNPSILEL